MDDSVFEISDGGSSDFVPEPAAVSTHAWEPQFLITRLTSCFTETESQGSA